MKTTKRTITASQENYEKLVVLKGKLTTARRKPVSINDAITFLLDSVNVEIDSKEKRLIVTKRERK